MGWPWLVDFHQREPDSVDPQDKYLCQTARGVGTAVFVWPFAGRRCVGGRGGRQKRYLTGGQLPPGYRGACPLQTEAEAAALTGGERGGRGASDGARKMGVALGGCFGGSGRVRFDAGGGASLCRGAGANK